MENKKSRPSFFEEGREVLLRRGSLLLQGCDDGGDKLLFAGNHSRQQQAFLWNLLDVVGLLEQFLRLVTAAQHDAVFFDDVGQQEGFWA